MQSLTSVRLRDYIIKNIREQILSGAFPGGMRLAQEELAAGLGVSRIPIREALQIMEEQGFVVRLPNRHMIVAELSEEQIHQSFQMIAEIQFRYGRFILESAGKVTFLAALGTWDREDERSFHQMFVAYLNNEYLCKVFKNMLDSYVDFACGLPTERKDSRIKLLLCAAAAFGKERWEEAENLFREYYELLEQEVTEERKRH